MALAWGRGDADPFHSHVNNSAQIGTHTLLAFIELPDDAGGPSAYGSSSWWGRPLGNEGATVPSDSRFT